METASFNTDTRFQRQLGFLEPKKAQLQKVCIIGAGATGSETAQQLAKMGLCDITVFDKDKVEEHNFPNQRYPIWAKGRKKVLALKKIVKEYTQVVIDARPVWFFNQPLSGIVISSVDTMKVRKRIFNHCLKNNRVDLIIDPRSRGEIHRILILNPHNPMEAEEYMKTLYSDAEVDPGPCTESSIIYSVSSVVSPIAQTVKKYINNEPLNKEIIIDLKMQTVKYF